MRREISWTKSVFGNTYELRNYKGKTGELKTSLMSSTATGIISDRKYTFRSTGIFSSGFEMICAETDALVAIIKFNFWKQRAQIKTKEHDYTWKHSNFWQTKWLIFDEKREYVKGHSNGFMTGGEISFRPSSEQMVLAGLFIKNRFMETSSGA